MLLAGFAAHERQIGARDAALKTLSTGYAQLAKRGQVVDTAYVSDTVALAYWKRRWASAKAAVQARDGSAEHGDTGAAGNAGASNQSATPEPSTAPIVGGDRITPRYIIATADSAIHACTAALTTCERRVAIRDSLLANRDSAIRLLGAKRITVKPRCVVGPSLSTDGALRLGVSCGLGF